MKNFKMFVKFCAMQLETGDYDAHIPFLMELKKRLRLSKEHSVWLGFLYMAYYTEGSAYVAFSDKQVRDRVKLPPSDLPITTQRRNLYGGRITRHLEELHEIPKLHKWLSVSDSWSSLLDRVGSVYGNGRWANYTTSELISHLGELGIEPDTYEILQSSGPRKGLVALDLQPTDSAAKLVADKLAIQGIEIPASVLESLLCDWAGMNKGTFYAGRNIDRQQGRILQVEEKLGVKLDLLWFIRRKVFPAYSLGELNGWEGIDKKRLKKFRDERKILTPGESR